MSPKSDLASFTEGSGFLVRRPFATLGLGALGMALAALPPLLQIKFGLPNDELTTSALTFAGLFPLEMYFLPRFLAEADASAGGSAQNPLGEWEKHFDERWLRSLAGKLLLALAFSLGFLCFVLPCLAVLFAFGWAPLRILLRGETVAEAFRGSLAMMLRGWRRVVVVILLLLAVNLGLAMILFWMTGSLEPIPDPWVQLTHPRIWVVNFLRILLSLWTSACLLALYRRVEAAAGSPTPDQPIIKN